MKLKINVSVIVPVYKTENYLEKCIHSIVNQNLDNIEIIIVNDGSPDNSENIIHKFSSKYSNIIYIKKENGGLSSARNMGLKYAKGEFIGFVDSDDYIDINMYSKMFNKAVKDNSDIVICDMKYDLKGKDISNNKFEDFGILDRNETLLRYLNHTYFRSHAQNKIYKKELFNEVNFPEGKLFEDMATFYKLLHRSNRVSFINEKLYYYNQGNEESITKKKFNLKNLDLIYNSADMIDFFKENNYKSEIINGSIELYFFSVKTLLDMLYSSKKNMENLEFNNMKKQVFKEINKDIYIEGLTLFYKNNRCNLLKYHLYNLNYISKFYYLKTFVKSII
ncbi:glycosyltransferase family 2 protein [Clostridium chromiireducens]|uniref:glycosyltransferase family 2 protein n=1 Tax=Clostridium chromiireducens TaxID=225345 RepID=UPI001921E083|nr:glycosyltransferase [Clostridium chromiireducens]